MLSEDICSLSRNSKENLDVLGDLESRVRKLRDTNMHGSSTRPWADRQVQAHPRMPILMWFGRRARVETLIAFYPRVGFSGSWSMFPVVGPTESRSALWTEQSHSFGKVNAFKLFPSDDQPLPADNMSLCSSRTSCVSCIGQEVVALAKS